MRYPRWAPISWYELYLQAFRPRVWGSLVASAKADAGPLSAVAISELQGRGVMT